MACFLVPAAEAVVTTVIRKAVVSKEKKDKNLEKENFEGEGRVPFSRKLKWLSNLLWGGSALLAFEHLWHGEIVPWFPFLTAAGDSDALAEVLHEMSTVGVFMAVFITLVWIGMTAVTNIMGKDIKAEETLKEEI